MKRNLDKKSKLERSCGTIFKFLLLTLPIALYFSYYPVISFGASESMNFEISLALIWLVLFDIAAFVLMIKRKMLWQGLKNKWTWLLLPGFLTVSIAWSDNPIRGVLTVGILWLIYFAGYGMWSLRELFDTEFRQKFWKWFMIATLLVCAWCFIQCILDLIGVAREQSLMCAGCTYKIFGFPHPNGFAIEPQFMGNLLLAPAIVVVCKLLTGPAGCCPPPKLATILGDPLHSRHPSTVVNKQDDCNSALRDLRRLRPSAKARSTRDDGLERRRARKALLPVILLFVISATLFLTFSRGAIYAFGVALVLISVMGLVLRKERKTILKRIGIVWGIIALAFVAILNLQGLMAEVSPTDDTYQSGVAKVLNHLSLGVIDIRENKTQENSEPNEQETNVAEQGSNEVESGVENKISKNDGEFEKEKSVFDGYAESSTEIRVRVSEAALKTWTRDVRTMWFGVGIGGAGQAMYDAGLSPAPKEIVQNEYISLLLEIGLVGVGLVIMTLVLVVRVAWRSEQKIMLIGLIVAYGITLLFFSGLANALQIYLMPMVLAVVLKDRA